MPWRFTHRVEEYADRVWPLLAVAPAANTVALTVIVTARAGAPSAGPALYGWYERGRVLGAVSLTPPYELVLALVPADLTAELAGALHGVVRGTGLSVPGVGGPTADVDRFATAWADNGGSRPRPGPRMRLYELGPDPAAVRAPQPAPPGRARPATDHDAELAVRWLRDFHREVGLPDAAAEPAVRDRIEDGRLWLWQQAGRPVALAARNRTAAGVARVGPVYTPPAHRRHGYGSAVTAACSGAALAADAAAVVLFADLANPTSNGIYQRIGYRPIGDYTIVHFDEAPDR